MGPGDAYDAQCGVEGLLVGDEDFLLHGVLPEGGLLLCGIAEGRHMRHKHYDEVEVGIGLVLGVVLGRELVDVLLKAGDMLFEAEPFGEFVAGVGIVDVGGHRYFGVNDDITSVVEVQQHVRP